VKQHVALAGFMASGKSTIGRKLARRLRWGFADTDACVVQRHGSIGTIFEREGEGAFRSYEQAAIREALQATRRSVIALGGGALTRQENRALLQAGAYVVFIKVSAEQVYARLRRSREIRPMLGAAPTLEAIKELYARRLPQYESADWVVDASRRSDADVIHDILGLLHDANVDGDRAAS
jgi:shikimate kinase